MKKTVSVFLLLVILGLPYLANASVALQLPSQLQQTHLYEVTWAGVHVGDLVTEVKQDHSHLLAQSYLLSRGIAYKFAKYQAVNASLSMIEDGQIKPAFYSSESSLRGRKRQILIDYDKQGQIASEQVTPPDKRDKRPAVDQMLKIGTVDPHTAIFQAYSQIMEIVDSGKSGQFTIPLYEARTRSELQFKVVPPSKEGLKRGEKIKVTLSRKAIAGFTKDELARASQEEPVIDIYLVLQEDGSLLPVKAYAKALIGTAKAVYKRSCPSVHQCVKGAVPDLPVAHIDMKLSKR